MPSPVDLGDLAGSFLEVLSETGDLVAAVDRDLRYVAANDAHVAAHRTTREQLLGKTIAEVMGEDAFATQLQARYERALAGAEVRFEGWFELRGPGRRYYAVSLLPRRDEAGAVVGALLVARDHTAREQATEAARRERERLALVVTAARMGIWEWDVVHDVLVWSDRALELFDVTREDFDGTYEAFLAFLHPEDHASVTDAVNEALLSPAAGDRYSVEYRIIRRDGRLRWQMAQGNVLRDDEGQPLRMIGMVTDITALKELEARLSQGEKLQAIGRLAGGVAHDFNNILTGVMGEAFLASEEAPSPAIRGSLEAIVAGCERAAMLTQRLLTFARQQPVAPRPTVISEVVEAMSVLLRWTVGDEVALELTLEPDVSAVMAAPSQIEQLLLNLVHNAREAIDGAGSIRVSSREVAAVAQLDPGGGPVVVLSVQDTGAGIDPAAREHIFEPFFTTRDTAGNSGLGLATCYGIAEQLGGVLHLADGRAGRTTFEVRLPATDAPTRTVTPPRALQAASTSAHILFVEDDRWVRAVTLGHLSSLGYRVTECESGAEALRRWQVHRRFDLLLTDIRMPELDGRELAMLLRRDDPDLPVLFVSGHAAPEDGQGALFLPKPYTRSELGAAIERALVPRAAHP